MPRKNYKQDIANLLNQYFIFEFLSEEDPIMVDTIGFADQESFPTFIILLIEYLELIGSDMLMQVFPNASTKEKVEARATRYAEKEMEINEKNIKNEENMVKIHEKPAKNGEKLVKVDFINKVLLD